MAQNTNTGTVKFYDRTKGYGFIKDDKSQQDVFVHATALKGKSLETGERVSYNVETGKKGKSAVDVQGI